MDEITFGRIQAALKEFRVAKARANAQWAGRPEADRLTSAIAYIELYAVEWLEACVEEITNLVALPTTTSHNQPMDSDFAVDMEMAQSTVCSVCEEDVAAHNLAEAINALHLAQRVEAQMRLKLGRIGDESQIRIGEAVARYRDAQLAESNAYQAWLEAGGKSTHDDT